MVKKAIIILMALTFVVSFGMLAVSQEKEGAKEEPKFEYIGAKKCRICHMKDKTYPTWEETKHAKAWESLTDEQKKDEECVSCHITAKLEDGTILEGVQCEACHGPGSEYKSMKVMKDRELAIKNGLLIPNEETCKKCHNENVPEEFRSDEPFDYAKMQEKGVHALPEKEAEKTE